MRLNETSNLTQRRQSQTWTRLDRQSRAEHRIEHPCGNRERCSLVELDNELFASSMPGTPQDAPGAVVEWMVSITDRHRRR